MNSELDINLLQLLALCTISYFVGVGVGYIMGYSKCIQDNRKLSTGKVNGNKQILLGKREK